MSDASYPSASLADGCIVRFDVVLDWTAGAGGVFVIHIVSLIPRDACRISLVGRDKGTKNVDLKIEIPTEFVG